MKVDPESTVPIYLQTANFIRQDLRDHAMKPGDQLPPDHVYCEAFGVSHMTLKKAMELLVNEGLVVRKQGVGTFVAEPKIRQSLFALGGFTGDNSGEGKKIHSKVLQFAVGESSDKVARKLGLKEQDLVINLKRLRMINDEVVALENSYLSYENQKYQGLLKHDFSKESLYEVLTHQYGVVLKEAEETVEVSVATEEISEELGVPGGRPMFNLSRLTYDTKKEPVEYVESVYRADRYIFTAVLTTS